eukprot:scaffold328_cov248-Pinguiococcus_pyrenoidosus.AAC.7
MAALDGHLETVELLMDAGASAEQRATSGSYQSSVASLGGPPRRLSADGSTEGHGSHPLHDRACGRWTWRG